MAASKSSRIQEKGQITLPAEIRKNLGLEKGDLVTFEECDGRVMIIPQKTVTLAELGDISAILEEYGVSLAELIESGREERGRILQEQYGYDDSQLRE